MNIVKKYEKYLQSIHGVSRIKREISKLTVVKMLLSDYETKGGTTSEDWNIVYEMESLANLRLMNLEETHWYDPIRDVFRRMS